MNQLGLAYTLLLSLGVLQLYLTVNRWQDLSQVAAGVEATLEQRPLVLWRPDETTLAWSDIYLKDKPRRIFFPDETLAERGVEPLLDYLRTTPQARVLSLAPRNPWPLATWIEFIRGGSVQQESQELPDFAPFRGRTDFHVDYLYEAPGGRRYVLLSHRAP